MVRKFIGSLKFWWQVRRVNKSLLAQASQPQPLYAAPTADEVAAALKEFRMEREDIETHTLSSYPKNGGRDINRVLRPDLMTPNT